MIMVKKVILNSALEIKLSDLGSFHLTELIGIGINTSMYIRIGNCFSLL